MQEQLLDQPATPRTGTSKPSARHPVWLSPAAWLVLLVVGVYFFSPLATVALGILAASIIACTLHPLMAWIPGPRGLAVAVVGLLLIAVAGGVIFALSYPLASPLAKSISNATDDWPKTKQAIDNKLKDWSEKVGLEPPKLDRVVEGFATFLAGTGGKEIFSRSADVVMGILIALTFTLIGSMFLLAGPPHTLIRPALRVVSERNRPALEAVLADLGPRYRWWVLGTLAGMCVVFTASATGYWVIGLKLAIPLALLAGFAEIVPTVGPATACVIATVIALATQGGAKALGVLAVYGIVQAMEAYVILPAIMRGAVNMHPAVTLFTVVLWGKIFGVPGLILAIPINVTLWSFLEHFRFRRRQAM